MTDSARSWRKAQRSYATNHCVELAQSDEGIVMRNSRRPGHQIHHTKSEFAVFLEAAKNGEFDHFVD